MKFFRNTKKEGKINHLGFSVHDAPEFLERILNEYPEVEFVQIAFNYYDYSAAWVQSKKCYDIIRRHGKLVNIMEPVKGGMLTYPPKALFEQMQAKRPGMTPAAWALRFAADQEGVQAISFRHVYRRAGFGKHRRYGRPGTAD